MSSISKKFGAEYFKTLENELVNACRKIIDEYIHANNNKDVYAFAITGDPFHGSICVRINNLESHTETVEKIYPHYTPNQLIGLHGIKHSPYEYAYSVCVSSYSDQIKPLLDKYYDVMVTKGVSNQLFHKVCNHYTDTLITACKRLKPDFENFQMTNDFISFVMHHDLSDENMIILLKSTLSEDQFNDIFPEINAYQPFIDRIIHLPIEEQITYWIQTLLDFKFEKITDNTEQIRYFNRGESFVLEMLEDIGQPATDALMAIIEVYATTKEINYKRKDMSLIEFIRFRKTLSRDERKKYDKYTVDCEISRTVLQLLINIEPDDDTTFERLQTLHKMLFNKSKSTDHVGPNLGLVSKALHVINPNLYPEPILEGNQLMNFDAYGLSD